MVGLRFGFAYILDNLGLDIYSSVRYPVGDFKVHVKPHPSWRRLEKGMHKEINCIKLVANIVKENYVIMDVGAWIGQYTLLFAELANRGRVYAFEPESEAYNVLCKNVERNNLRNICVERIALSSSTGRAKFFAFGKTNSSLIKHVQENNPKVEIVETSTLDDYCSRRDLKPDLIKIDVEGAEMLVLDGAKKIIQEYSPRILLEFHAGMMTEQERRANWKKIAHLARKLVFLAANPTDFNVLLIL
jgi:FkbM family methyltransferase